MTPREPADRPSAPPPPEDLPPGEPRDEYRRSTLERLLPELIRRGIEAGRNVGDSMYPKEVAAAVLHQLGDARHQLVRAVASEVGRFLRDADIASEVRRVLEGMDVEVHMEVKLRPRAKEDAPAEAPESAAPPPPSARPPPPPAPEDPGEDPE